MTVLPESMLPVYEKDGFLFFKKGKNADPNDALIIDVSKIQLISRYMQRNNLKNITINSAYFPVDNLLFLKHLSFVQKISIVDDNHDISPVNELHELLHIGLGDFTGTIDFNNFPNLNHLGIDWSNKLKNLENASNLNWLWLDGYKADSLEKFKNLTKLTFLYLNTPSIKSLKGIDGMIALRELSIDTARKLETLDGLNENNKKLIDLDIYNARKLVDYNALKYLINLEKLRFTKTGDIENIDILKTFRNLKKVILGIKILDGNMNHLNNIKEVGFIDFPHYSHKMKDFK
jgi:hypothetical protein